MHAKDKVCCERSDTVVNNSRFPPPGYGNRRLYRCDTDTATPPSILFLYFSKRIVHISPTAISLSLCISNPTPLPHPAFLRLPRHPLPLLPLPLLPLPLQKLPLLLRPHPLQLPLPQLLLLLIALQLPLFGFFVLVDLAELCDFGLAGCSDFA